MKNKFTDNEIIKALEGAISLSNMIKSKVWSLELYKIENALDLINRQKAEIERLKDQFREATKKGKAEARKEFAELIKQSTTDKSIGELPEEMEGEDGLN